MAAINTPNVTLSFPNLFVPKPRAMGGNPVFSCAGLVSEIEQKSAKWKAVQDAVRECAIAEFGEKVNMATLQLPFADAGLKADRYAGYEPGVIVINPWSKQKPGIVGPRLEDILSADDVYAGQIVRLNITPFAWNNTGRKGVSLGLNHVQIVKMDAPRIDGRAPANKVFDAVEDTADVF